MKILLSACLGVSMLVSAMAWAGSHLTVQRDGTVQDGRTGLIWTRNGNCFGAATWTEAQNLIQALNQGTRSCDTLQARRTDWRLPSKAELATLLDASRHESGLSLAEPKAFKGVQRAHYWTRDVEPGQEQTAWYVNLHNGHQDLTGRQEVYHVWPVAGGSR